MNILLLKRYKNMAAIFKQEFIIVWSCFLIQLAGIFKDHMFCIHKSFYLFFFLNFQLQT